MPSQIIDIIFVSSHLPAKTAAWTLDSGLSRCHHHERGIRWCRGTPFRGVQQGRQLVGFAWMPEGGGRWQGTGPRQRTRMLRGYVDGLRKQPVGRHAAPRRQLRPDSGMVRVHLDDLLGPAANGDMLRPPESDR